MCVSFHVPVFVCGCVYLHMCPAPVYHPGFLISAVPPAWVRSTSEVSHTQVGSRAGESSAGAPKIRLPGFKSPLCPRLTVSPMTRHNLSRAPVSLLLNEKDNGTCLIRQL